LLSQACLSEGSTVDTQQRILELLNCGDWACAYNERQSLAHVCRKLAVLLEANQSERARTVARSAAVDMRAATHDWAELAAELRRSRRRGPLGIGLAHPGAASQPA
jgi:hypothetical protein